MTATPVSGSSSAPTATTAIRTTTPSAAHAPTRTAAAPGPWRARLTALTQHPRRLVPLLVIVGIVTHLPIFTGAISIDTCVQLEMAESLFATGQFQVLGAPSNFFPPVLPLLMAPFIAVGGATPATLHTFQLVVFAITLVVGYLVGRRFGRTVGYLVMAGLIVDPVIYGSMTAALGEVVVVLLLLLSFESILRGLKNPKWMMAAGLVAGVAYLTKASTGSLIIVAGLIGLSWRFYYERWALLRNRGYLLGILVFVVTILPWTVRNYLRVGSIWTGRYASESLHHFVAQPLVVTVPLVARYLLIFIGYLALLLVPVVVDRRLYEHKRRVVSALARDQALSALAVFVLGTVVIGAVMAAALVSYTPSSEGLPHIRYVGVIDPFVFMAIGVWLTRRHRLEPRARKGGKKEAHALVAGGIVRVAIILGILALLIVPNHAIYSYRDRYDDLETILETAAATGTNESAGTSIADLVIWSNMTLELRYNMRRPPIMHHYSDWREIPPNATVVASGGLPASVEPDEVLTYSSTDRPWITIVYDWPGPSVEG